MFVLPTAASSALPSPPPACKLRNCTSGCSRPTLQPSTSTRVSAVVPLGSFLGMPFPCIFCLIRWSDVVSFHTYGYPSPPPQKDGVRRRDRPLHFPPSRCSPRPKGSPGSRALWVRLQPQRPPGHVRGTGPDEGGPGDEGAADPRQSGAGPYRANGCLQR